MLARLSTGGLSAGPRTGDFPHEHWRNPGLPSRLLPIDGVGLPNICPAPLPRLAAEDWDWDDVAEWRLAGFGLGIAHGDALLPLFGMPAVLGNKSNRHTDVVDFVGDMDGDSIGLERARGDDWHGSTASDEAIMDARPP